MKRVFHKIIFLAAICISLYAISLCSIEAAEVNKQVAEEGDYVQSGIYSNEFSTPLPNGNSSVMVGTTVGIQKIGDDTIRIKAIHCARTAIAETGVCEATVVGNKATFTWEDPGFLSSGEGEVVFNEDSIVLTMNTIVGARFTFLSESETLEMKDDASMADFIREELGMTMQDGENVENIDNVENPQDGMNVAVG